MKGHRVYDRAVIDSVHPDHQYMIRQAIDDGELACTAITRAANPSVTLPMSPAPAGPSSHLLAVSAAWCSVPRRLKRRTTLAGESTGILCSEWS